MTARAAAALALVVSCATPSMPPPAKLSTPAQPPARAVSPPADAEHLRALSDRYWATLLGTAKLTSVGEGGLGGPLEATSLGDHRFDARLDDFSPDALNRVHQELAALRTEVDSIQTGELGGEDVLTLQILRGQLDDIRDSRVCQGELWLVDQMRGPHLALAQTASFYPLGTQKGVDELLARLGQAGRMFDQLIAALQLGLARGLTSPRNNVQLVIDQLDALKVAEMLPPEEKFAGLPADQRKTAREHVAQVMQEQVLTGARRYRDFLHDRLLPKARTDVGLWALPGGNPCYAFAARYHTGSALKARELHELGLRELAKIEAEQAEIARSQGAAAPGGKVDLKAFRSSVNSRADQFKQTADELLEWNRATLARAMAALPQAFHRLPPRAIETRPIESWRAASSTPAFYQAAPDDGSQPAVYYVNVYKPETRALYNEEALCFHETVPGHHLQMSLAQELKGLPDFRRQTGETAFIEGWALYTERMADDTLHLYSGPLARYGMLGYQAWRASRLVVDTGMHALHWDRARALQFMRDHTTLTEREAANEVDRYVIVPGQALAFMVGELELLRLRELARARLGAQLDLRDFHDVVLNHGAVPMATATRLVGEWLDRVAPQPPKVAR